MGLDERLNRIRETAELERTTGAVREFAAVAACQKCELPREANGVLQFMIAFCIGNNPLQDPASKKPNCIIYREHLHVVCPRCHYGWYERCKDFVADPDDAPIESNLVRP